MCRLMGSHFHRWIDYNGVAFCLELLGWNRTWDLGDQKIQVGRDLKWEDFYFIKFNQCVNSFQDDLVKRLYK